MPIVAAEGWAFQAGDEQRTNRQTKDSAAAAAAAAAVEKQPN
jgi:hypothetical protein